MLPLPLVAWMITTFVPLLSGTGAVKRPLTASKEEPRRPVPFTVTEMPDAALTFSMVATMVYVPSVVASAPDAGVTSVISGSPVAMPARGAGVVVRGGAVVAGVVVDGVVVAGTAVCGAVTAGRGVVVTGPELRVMTCVPLMLPAVFEAASSMVLVPGFRLTG